MRYCVLKNTTTIIDDFEGNSVETMLQNAQNAGFAESEVEVLTEEEYQARLENEPKSPQPPSEKERLEALEQSMLEIVLGGM